MRTTAPSILAIEAKGGKDISDRQAKAYGAMQATDVRRQSSDVPDGPVRTIYACFEGAAEMIKSRLEDVSVNASIIAVGTVRVVLLPAEGHEDLAFDVAVPPGDPPSYIPVDELSDDKELQEVLLPAVIAFAAQSRERVSIQAVCEEAFELWTQLGQQSAKRMKEKATRVLQQLASGEFQELFELESRGRDLADAVLRIKRTPAQFEAQGQTQGWQALSRRAERVLRGRARKASEGQLTFEDLAKQDKVGEEE